MSILPSLQLDEFREERFRIIILVCQVFKRKKQYNLFRTFLKPAIVDAFELVSLFASFFIPLTVDSLDLIERGIELILIMSELYSIEKDTRECLSLLSYGLEKASSLPLQVRLGLPK